MTGLEDLNQKVIVVTFTSVLLFIWWYEGTISQDTDLASRGHFRHIDSKRLAHASVLSF